MPAIDEHTVLKLEQSCKRDVFLDGVSVLLTLLNNVLKEPDNLRFRTIKLENKTIKEKLLVIPGIKDLLLSLGFEETSGTLQLSQNVPLFGIRKCKDLLQARYDFLLQEKNRGVLEEPSSSKTVTGTKRKLKRQQFRGKLTNCKSFQINEDEPNSFFRLMETMVNQVLTYENEELLQYGRDCIPLEQLKTNTLEKMRIIQKSIKSGKSKRQDPIYEEVFLRELTAWFNESFFQWVNQMPCKVCKKTTSKQKSSYSENGTRVEETFCCNKPTKFYRYNDIPTLLITRQGRCGEYANCFTFLCRALNYDARYVVATFDHVWTEVYSPFQNRWIHVDPSENVVDSPLMYSFGWNRTVDYVIAYSKDDIQDVTWRYCNDHQALLSRRNNCSEHDLVSKILGIRNKLQENCSKARRNFLVKRNLMELVQLMLMKEPTDDERRGRSSGDVEWRKDRGEHESNMFYVFKPIEEDLIRRQFNMRYSSAKDIYERYIKDAGANKILSTSKGWESCHYSSKNIFRKEEKDWKMVYLARTEDTDAGHIEWKFDFTDNNLSIKTITTKFETKLYENGIIKLQYLHLNGQPLQDVSQLKGSSGFIIRASLTGGKGEIAWQHTQLFRDETSSTKFPFEICITFNE